MITKDLKQPRVHNKGVKVWQAKNRIGLSTKPPSSGAGKEHTVEGF